MPDLRPSGRGRPDDRGRPAGPAPRPFRPPPRPDLVQPLLHTLKLRDGDREIEVSGTAAFVRQVIEDLPDLWARMQGQRPAQPAAIRMPRPPAEAPLSARVEES